MDTADTCSWLLNCKYFLKLPEAQNAGACRGTVCHKVFEVLTPPEKEDVLKDLMKTLPKWKHPEVDALLKSEIKKSPVPLSKDDVKLIRDMIACGLQSDFCDKGGRLISPEKKFILETPSFTLSGIIDRLSEHDGFLRIRDYKSSKMKFTGNKKTSNTQGLAYSYAVREMYGKPSQVQFVFLRFSKSPMMEMSFTNKQLDGFGKYLGYMQTYLDDFNDVAARGNFAFDSFDKRWMCGSTKEGKWTCPFRKPFEYYAIIDAKGNIVKTSLQKDKLSPKEGESIIKKKYFGCPRFKTLFS